MLHNKTSFLQSLVHVMYDEWFSITLNKTKTSY